jgi:predicted AAA+ superfamily ATPase
VGAYLLARGKEEGFSVCWWRDRELEVDFVIQKGTSALTAIEVKSGRMKHTGGGIEFLRRYPDAFSLTIGSGGCELGEFLEGKVTLFK